MKVYFDNNATTPLSSLVRKEMERAADNYGNPSSIHSFGVQARNIVEKSRRKIASALNCEADDIIFTSGGTESDNLAIFGTLSNLKKKTDKKHIITSRIEHHAVLNVFKYLEKNGYEVSWLDVDEYGSVNPEDVKKALRETTIFVSIMLANNEVGVIEPLKKITSLIKEKNPDIVVHTDSVQAFGKINCNVQNLGVDLLTISAHKINGPKGVGALYIRKGLKINKIVFGGHHERGIRPGTENVISIAGFGMAAELAQKEFDENNKKLQYLKDRLMAGIEKNIKNIKVNSHSEKCLSNTLNISFNNVEGEGIIMMLDMEGIAVSSGSACTSGSLETSHVMVAMRVNPVSAQGSIRFSLGKNNTSEEIDYVIEKLPPIIERLRKMSPLQ